MTVKTFIIGSVLSGIIGASLWFLVVTQIQPERAGVIGFLLFFLSLFVAISSLASLVGYGLRRIIMRSVFPAYSVRTSLRQGLMMSIFFSLLLFLQLMRLYRWWISLVLIAILAAVEVVFLSYERTNHRQPEKNK